MILLNLHVSHIALNDSLLVQRILSQATVTIAHTVTLKVSLGHNINTILVAQVIPTWIVGIVAGAHGVHVQLLHDLDILNHAIDINHITTIGIKFVAVGTLEQNSLAVDEQLSACYLYLAESHLLSNGLNHLVITVTESYVKGVKVRYFG